MILGGTESGRLKYYRNCKECNIHIWFGISAKRILAKSQVDPKQWRILLIQSSWSTFSGGLF